MPLAVPAWLWASLGFLKTAKLLNRYAAWDKYPGAASMIYVIVAVNSLFAVISILLNIQFFGKWKSFPASMIIVMLAQVVWLLIMSQWSKAVFQTGGDPSSAIGATIGSLIWVWYLLCSKRVKVTFVR